MPPRVLLLGDTRSVGHHGSTSVVEVILHEMGNRGIEVVSTPKMSDLATEPELLRSHSIKGIVINAEGALHGESKHASRFAQVVEACSHIEMPCFVVNAVLDKCDREATKKLQRATGMFCRERRSTTYAHSLGIPVHLCPDLTFALKLSEPYPWHSGTRVIVTDSTIEAVNRSLHNFAQKNQFSFVPLRGAPQITSYLDRRSVSRATKYAIRKKIGRLFAGNFQADRYGCAVETAQQFMREITNHTKLVVTGRFHGVCLCLKLGVPFLAIQSNTHKVEGLLEDAGFSNRLVALETLNDESSWSETLRAAENWSADDESNRHRYLALADNSIKACFDCIATTIKKSRCN